MAVRQPGNSGEFLAGSTCVLGTHKFWYPQNGWLGGEIPFKWFKVDDLGVPLVLGNPHIVHGVYKPTYITGGGTKIDTLGFPLILGPFFFVAWGHLDFLCWLVERNASRSNAATTKRWGKQLGIPGCPRTRDTHNMCHRRSTGGVDSRGVKRTNFFGSFKNGMWAHTYVQIPCRAHPSSHPSSRFASQFASFILRSLRCLRSPFPVYAEAIRACEQGLQWEEAPAENRGCGWWGGHTSTGRVAVKINFIFVMYWRYGWVISMDLLYPSLSCQSEK